MVGDVFFGTLDPEVWEARESGLDNCFPLSLNHATGVPYYQSLGDFFTVLAKHTGKLAD